jgi:hypothetical protein
MSACRAYNSTAVYTKFGTPFNEESLSSAEQLQTLGGKSSRTLAVLVLRESSRLFIPIHLGQACMVTDTQGQNSCIRYGQTGVAHQRRQSGRLDFQTPVLGYPLPYPVFRWSRVFVMLLKEFSARQPVFSPLLSVQPQWYYYRTPVVQQTIASQTVRGIPPSVNRVGAN